jgi:hypothetical protein
MTQDEIIEMAMEAEFVSRGKPSEEESELFVCTDKDIVRFAKLVAAKAIAELESQEQPLPPVEIGVDVTADGASVVALYRRPNAVMEVFYSQFHPTPQRTWVGLTDDDIDFIYTGIRAVHHDVDSYVLCRAVEARLKEKNS